MAAAAKTPGGSAADQLTVAEIVAMLSERIESLARDLLPAGHYDQGQRMWRCGDVGGSQAGQSLVVWLSGAKQGQWYDFAAAEGGDGITLIRKHHGLDGVAAIQWAKDWLGISPYTGRPTKRREPGVDGARQATGHRIERSDLRHRQASALALWRSAVPAPGTIVEAYLRGRGITLPPPATLRLLPLHQHLESGAVLPCMLQAVQAEDGRRFLTVNRLWFELPGRPVTANGSLAMAVRDILALGPDTPTVKTHLSPPRKAYGPYKGGAVRLEPAGSTLAIGEGAETLLSVKQYRPDWTVWSAVALANIRNVWIPPQVDELVIIRDGDLPDSRAHAAADRIVDEVARMARDTGRALKVRAADPPTGFDFNDGLRGAAEASTPPEGGAAQPTRPETLPELGEGSV